VKNRAKELARQQIRKDTAQQARVDQDRKNAAKYEDREKSG